MSKYYLIGKLGYEYNDEIYHRPYGCEKATEPQILYRNEDTAEKICLGRNIDEYLHEDLQGYGYNVDEVFPNYERIIELAEKYGLGYVSDDIENIDEAFKKLIKKLSNNWKDGVADINNEADFKTLLSACKIKFYEVYEVELMD